MHVMVYVCVRTADCAACMCVVEHAHACALQRLWSRVGLWVLACVGFVSSDAGQHGLARMCWLEFVVPVTRGPQASALPALRKVSMCSSVHCCAARENHDQDLTASTTQAG